MKEKERILSKIENDKTRPVLFTESFGGSENQFRLLLKYVPDEYFKEIKTFFANDEKISQGQLQLKQHLEKLEINVNMRFRELNRG